MTNDSPLSSALPAIARKKVTAATNAAFCRLRGARERKKAVAGKCEGRKSLAERLN